MHVCLADDIAEDAAFCFFPRGRPESVLEVIKMRLRNNELRESIIRELDTLPAQPYWKHGGQLPKLMALIADAYREAHRDFFLIRRYVAVVCGDPLMFGRQVVFSSL